jgi:pimeloyl-ACP methyl ester carboxylesterase
VGEAPKTEYVAVGDADVASQVVGGRPLDVLYFYGLGSNIEALQLTPGFEEFLKRLSSFARVILFDRRGTGASDGVPRSAIPTVEEWTDDVLAVLECRRVGARRDHRRRRRRPGGGAVRGDAPGAGAGADVDQHSGALFA